jgi:hypothetical protein
MKEIEKNHKIPENIKLVWVLWDIKEDPENKPPHS